MHLGGRVQGQPTDPERLQDPAQRSLLMALSVPSSMLFSSLPSLGLCFASFAGMPLGLGVGVWPALG